MLEFLRKDLLLVLAIAAVFLSLSYAIGYVSDRPQAATEVQTAFLKGERAPRVQPTAERVFTETDFEKLLAIGAGAAGEPVAMRVDGAGNLYLLDWANFKVKMFSPEGNLLKEFGKGKGKGAGAFNNPTGLSVTPEGELWVCDPRQQQITHFTPNGEAQTIRPLSAVDRIAAVGDVLVTKAPPGKDDLFEVYSQSGEPLGSYGEILEEQSDKGIILDGNIVGDPESKGFIYGGRFVGVLAGYGAGGEQRFVVRTIDAAPPPKILNIAASRKIKPNSAQSVLSLSVSGNELYVLSGTRAEGTGGQVMDVYDKRDGGYRFSLKLPVPCSEAAVRADYIYTLNKEGVTVWRFRQRT